MREAANRFREERRTYWKSTGMTRGDAHEAAWTDTLTRFAAPDDESHRHYTALAEFFPTSVLPESDRAAFAALWNRFCRVVAVLARDDPNVRDADESRDRTRVRIGEEKKLRVTMCETTSQRLALVRPAELIHLAIAEFKDVPRRLTGARGSREAADELEALVSMESVLIAAVKWFWRNDDDGLQSPGTGSGGRVQSGSSEARDLVAV